MRRFVPALHICVVLVSALLAHAQTFTTLANFDGSNGYNPSGVLIQASDGYLYGLTAKGGTYDSGVLFQASTSGTLTSIGSAPAYIGTPSGRVVQPGSYYGDSFAGMSYGGQQGGGSFFSVGPGFFTVWFSFCTWCTGTGTQPYSGVIQASDSKLYFTTSEGGTSNACSGGCGTVAKMFVGGDPVYLHSFNGSDGANPRAELVEANDGNFYGTTVNGGSSNCQNGCGTIFRVTPNGDFTALYNFCSQSNCADGANPYSALVQGSDNNLYGTTSAGGNVGVNCPPAGCGTIFKITLDGTLTTLYSFCADFFCPTGANPQSGLVQATDGNFYGTTYTSGSSTFGTLFRITPQGKLSLLHTFTGDDGAYPISALLLASDGKFYGTTTQGGTGFGGTLFSLNVDFNLALSVSKSGNGTITSDDNKIQCGSVCSANYESGDVVNLTATPDQQWGFVSWSGCDSFQANVCTVTMHHARNATANFAPLYALSVADMGSGTITSNDGYINCGQTCSYTYLAGSYVLFTASAAPNWSFIGWTGCDFSNGNTCTVKMNNARNVSAMFKLLYRLTVSKSGSGVVLSGTIYCGTMCSSTYQDGTTVKLTANPSPGYTFDSWSGCDNAQGNFCTLGMSAPRNVIATFIPDHVTLTSLVLRPDTVKGGYLSVATVSILQPAPPGGVGIDVSSDHPSVAHPQLPVIVQAGKTSAVFAVNTFPVKTKTPALITASAGSSQVSATLTVTTTYSREQTEETGKATDTGATQPKSTVSEKVTSSGGRSLSPQSGGPSRTLASPPPPADPADERKEYPIRFMGTVARVGEYNGDLRDLPQIPSRETPEPELVEPVDRVHKVLPALPPADTLMASVGPMPPPIASFLGMAFADDHCGFFCGVGHPPDPTGAVGLKYYVQAINKSYAFFDKNSNALLATLSESEVGGLNYDCESNARGDPVVLYDQTADRWILTNFAFEHNDGPFYQCIAVSKSGDPVNGGWWFYAIQTDQDPVPAGTLNDYPKFGIWNDGCLYMGGDGFFNSSSYTGQVILSINTSDMYNGNPVRYSLSFLSGSANFALFPATMLGAGANLPPPTEGEYYVQESQTSDAFNVRTLPAGSCVSGGNMSAAVAVPHDTYNFVPQNIVAQPPPATGANNLDSLENVIMQWVQYRKVGAKESLWVNHTTYVTNSNTSPQWAQIDVTGGNINTQLVQQQIFRPDPYLYRWMGSLAVDKFGDMALCYSTSNASVPNYPSIQCAGRLATDPLGQLPQGETEYVAGNGSQIFNCGGDICHRWGDYSSTTVDPIDDCTFWHTNMFYDNQGDGYSGYYNTQIIAFRYPNCVPPPPVTLTVVTSGSGTVTSNDGYINCGSTCSHEYNIYTTVMLNAIAAPGWYFSGWSRCDNVQAFVCVVTMYGSKTISAIFTQLTNPLTVVDMGDGKGAVTSNDGFIKCGSICSHDYPLGTPVTLTANPAQGSRFDGWTGCDFVDDRLCTLTMAAPRFVTATFDLVSTFHLSVAKWGSGSGTVTSGDGYINCGSACFHDYNPGDTVALTAHPKPGSLLTGWVGCDQVQDGICTVKMVAVRNVIAKLELATYVLTVNKSGSGTVRSNDGYINCGATCSYTYQSGTYVVLTAPPDQGWALTGWTGCDWTDGTTCTVQMNSAHNVIATFRFLFPLTVSKSGSGLVISGDIYCGSKCSSTYADGTTVRLTANPAPGYTLDSWIGCDNAQGNFCILGLTGPRDVTATFVANQITLTSLVLQPDTVKGGKLSVATVTLSQPAPPGGLGIDVSSDHPTVAHPQLPVIVQGGKTTAIFAVNTFPVKSNTSVLITAAVGSSQASATLTVTTPY